MNIPPHSLPLFTGIDLNAASDVHSEFLKLLVHADQTTNHNDPSKCKFLVSLKGAIMWSAKLSIDADGPAVADGFKNGVELDPDSGQLKTSLKFENGNSLPSEGVPYYVLPGGDFGHSLGLALGNVCVVIKGDKMTAAVLGDIGPGIGGVGHGNPKIGEASIRLHNRLRPNVPDPCSRRDAEGRCLRARNASVEEDVICIAFPGTKVDGLALETCQAQIEAAAAKEFASIGGTFVPA